MWGLLSDHAASTFDSYGGWSVCVSQIDRSEDAKKSIQALLCKPKTRRLAQTVQKGQETWLQGDYLVTAVEEATYYLVAHADVGEGCHAVVGFVTMQHLCPMRHPAAGGGLEMLSLVAAATYPHVRETTHGGGIGTGLLDAVEALAFCKSAEHPVVAVCAWALPSLLPWYENRGFKVPHLHSEPNELARRIDVWVERNTTIPIYLPGPTCESEEKLVHDLLHSVFRCLASVASDDEPLHDEQL